MQENNILNQNKTILDKVIFSILLAVSFLTPIFFVPATFISPQFGTSLIFSFGVILSILVYIFSGLKNGSVDLPNPSRYILGSIFIVPIIYTLAGITNGFSRMTFLGYTFDISTVGFILLGFSYLFLVSIFFREKSRIFYSYIAFVFSCVLLSVFIILRIIFGADFLSFGIFSQLNLTMVGSWNNISILFGVGAILSLLTIEMVNVTKIFKVLLFGALLLSLFFIQLVNFSIVWLILAICFFILAIYNMFNPSSVEAVNFSLKDRIKRVPKVIFVVFLLTTILYIFNGSFIDSQKTNTLGSYLSNKFKITNVEVRPSFKTTIDIANNTIKQDPFFGSGPNTFINQWLAWKPVEVVSTVFWNTDFASGAGLLPTFAVTTGILGILSWLIFFGCYIYLGIKAIFLKTVDNFVRYLINSSFFTSLYLWIMAFLYTPSVVVFIMTLFFTGLFFSTIFLSGIINVEKKSFVENPKAGFVYSLVLVSIFVACASLSFELFKNSKSFWYFQKSSFALNKSNNPDLSEKYMLEAIKYVPYDIYYRSLSEIELAKMNNIFSQDPNKVDKAEIQKQFNVVLSNAIKASLAAKETDPSNYLNWLSLARIYESVSSPSLNIQGSFESSENAYNEALKRNPKNPLIYASLSRLSVTHGDLKKARDYAISAVKLKNNYLDAYFLLSQIEVADNNIYGAIQSVTAASIIDPTNPATFFQLGLLKYNAKDFVGAIVAFERAVTIVPDYANAKYFLGLSYELTGQHAKAIKEFNDLKKTNPDNKDVNTILTNLESGKPLFTNTSTSKPEKSKSLPIKQTTE